MKIWLRYQNGVTATSMRIDAAIFAERHDTEREVFSSLKGRRYSFLISKRKAYYLEIGADELGDASKKNFIDAFYTSELQFISLENIATEPATFTPVVIEESGNAPVSFVENSELFPEYSFTLTEAIGA